MVLMKRVRLIGQLISWVGVLALCAAIFGISMFALVTLLNRGEDRSVEPRAVYSDYAERPLPGLTAEDFDVRNVVSFLADRAKARDISPPPPAVSQPLETVRTVTASTDVAAQDVAHIGGTAVNLRTGPSKTSPRLLTLEPGEAVQIVAMNGGWSRVVTSSGESGWVFTRYLDQSGIDAETAVGLMSSPQWSSDETEVAGNEVFAYAEPTISNQARGFTLSEDRNEFRRKPAGKPLSLATSDGSPFWSYD